MINLEQASESFWQSGLGDLMHACLGVDTLRWFSHKWDRKTIISIGQGDVEVIAITLFDTDLANCRNWKDLEKLLADKLAKIMTEEMSRWRVASSGTKAIASSGKLLIIDEVE